jgi:hypothetical protein
LLEEYGLTNLIIESLLDFGRRTVTSAISGIQNAEALLPAVLAIYDAASDESRRMQ